MQSIVTIAAPVATVRLTTLDRVKQELNIDDNRKNAILQTKIDEASSDIQAAMGYRLPSEDVTETFWHDSPQYLGYHSSPLYGRADSTIIFLKRTPVSKITSVTVDDDVLDPTEYRFDEGAGLLYRIDGSGYPCHWWFGKSVVVVYTAGFILPGESGRNLEPAIEGAVVALVSSYWFNKGRNGMVKSENIPGVRQVEYWVGAVGDPELLPPRVLASIAQFRRPAAA